MQKGSTYFDSQTGKMVHRDLSTTTNVKGKRKMTDIENGTAAEKRTDKKVRIDFHDQKGATHRFPVEGCRKISAVFVEAGGTDELDLEALDPDMIYRLAAFGASVLGRNEVNTTKEDEGPDAAKDNLLARWEGFRKNSYRSVSSGTATPIILLALERALRSAGMSEEKVNEKVAQYRAKYDDAGPENDDKVLRKNRSEVGKQLRGVAEIRQAEKEIKEEREAARAANAKQVDLASI